MKPDNLSDAIGSLNEEMIEEANNARKKRRKMKWIPWVAGAACIAVAVAIARPMFTKETADEKVPLGKSSQTVFYDADQTLASNYIARAQYPEMLKCPNMDDFMDDWDAYDKAYSDYLDEKWDYRESFKKPENENYFDSFYQKSAQQFLSNSDGENVVFSPSNVYMALAMLAELTDSESRQQILELLGTESVESLRTEAKYLWGTNYSDDGLLTTRMANSLWLGEGLSYRQETMDLIAKEYYASSFSGVMGSDEYSEMLRTWINEQTNGLLENQAQDLEFDARTVMALASTIYFKGRWTDTFSDIATKPETFHAADGDVTVDFMHSSNTGVVYWGDSFTATKKAMENSASMWLILPDEDKTVEDVLSEGEIFEMTASNGHWENSKSMMVNLSMPKFDVSSEMDLIEGLQELGVSDVFDYTVSDFTPMSEELEQVYISQAEHAARVMVDEEGCEAAAYTVMMAECMGAILDEEEIDFVLDRPFIFVITGCGDTPLFIGVVNQV